MTGLGGRRWKRKTQVSETGPGGVTIREVRGLDSPYLPVAVELFESIFPDYVRYSPYVRACALGRSPDHPATLDHVWIVEQGNQPVGIRILSYVHTRNFGHDAFVGVLAPYRGQGIGGWLVERSLAQLSADARSYGWPEPMGYCAEVERPEDAVNEADRLERERALDFHLKHGGVLLEVDYVEPLMIRGVSYFAPEELTGEQPSPMALVFYPLQPERHLGGDDLVRLVEGLYLDVYRLESGDPLLRRAMQSIGR
jgi:GNAT superfamily N-acetyltransferase